MSGSAAGNWAALIAFAVVYIVFQVMGAWAFPPAAVAAVAGALVGDYTKR